MTPGDRQSYYEDCHTLQDVSRNTTGPAGKGCIGNGYGLHASTLTMLGTAHNGTPATGETFLTMEGFSTALSSY